MSRQYITAIASVAALLVLSGAGGCQKSASPRGAEKPAAADKADEKGAAKDEAADTVVPTVSVAVVKTGTLENALAVTGTLSLYRDRTATVAPPVAGVLDQLPVRFGQTVTRGQILAHLSTRPLEGQIAQGQAAIAQNTLQVEQARTGAAQQQNQTSVAILQAQAAVSTAQANLAAAQATLTGSNAALASARQALVRAQSLFAEGLVARKDVEAADLAVRAAQSQAAAQTQAVAAQRETVRSQQDTLIGAKSARLADQVKRGDIEVARQQLQGARGALQTTQAQFALYTLRAPISGVVTAVNAGLGEAVDPTVKLVTIADLSRMQLQIAVPGTKTGGVHIGQSIEFTTDTLPGRTFRSVIRTIGTQTDPATGTVTAVAEVDNQSHALRDGLFVRVRIVTARRKNVVLVPRAAVLYETEEGGAASVLLLGADSTVHKTPVQIGGGSPGGDTLEVISGLRAGQKVVTVGAFGLPDGAKVQTADAAPANETKAP